MRSFIFIIIIFVYLVNSQHYYEDEPRYSRKTPYRQQGDIPEAVFGVGHGSRRGFGKENSGENENRNRRGPKRFFEDHPHYHQPLRPYAEALNTGREDGDDSSENGQYPQRKRANNQMDGFDHSRRFNPDFRRPQLPDSREIKQRFDRDREEKNQQSSSESEVENRKPNRKPDQSLRNRELEEPGEKIDENDDNMRRGGKKVVGLNMQMVAGYYPKKSIEVPNENHQKQKLFQEENERLQHETEKDEHGRREHQSSTEDVREPFNERNERSERKNQRTDRQLPPSKPQIPPFPAFPKFPGFEGYTPFQPDFPSRRFGGLGGFARSPWDEPRGPEHEGSQDERDETKRPPRHRFDEDEERFMENRQLPKEKPHTATTSSSRDSSAIDESAEQANRQPNRPGKQQLEDQEKIENKENRENKEPALNEMKNVDTAVKKNEFPVPGRFVTSIRAKKSGELFNSTLAPTTATIAMSTELPTTRAFRNIEISEKSVILPNEEITKN